MTAAISHTHGTSGREPASRVIARVQLLLLALVTATAWMGYPAAAAIPDKIDFNRDVRRILSENCFKCHGPDAKERKGGKRGLRLDTAETAQADLGGHAAIVPGHPERSEMVRRIETGDPDDIMPPPKSGKALSQQEVAILKRWIEQGAVYSRHWSYVKPTRPLLPALGNPTWPNNAIDAFILARLDKEGLKPSPEADRHALIRRVALDLTGLPPTLEEVRQFDADTAPGAYERMVDRFLAREAFGEHWARLWLDLARYADSSGYADDPARTIWAYRDYVVRSLNANKPFDQFTLEQLAGDLLPDPTDEQLVATAFHRNTMTNNEGGTNDEEYRNVAVVDRVNTTMAVWMGTTMACAQCHNHKYDPITQDDYFRFFAILNNSADADRGDESPVLPLYSEEQKSRKRHLASEISRLQKIVQTTTPELERAQTAWETRLAPDLHWQALHPVSASSKSGAPPAIDDAGTVRIPRTGGTNSFTLKVPVSPDSPIHALRVEILPDDKSQGPGDGNMLESLRLSGVRAEVVPPGDTAIKGRHLRVDLPGRDRILSLAEVQIFSGTNNVARTGEASQSSTAFDGPARLAIDGNTSGDFNGARSTTHTETSSDPWWEVDLKSSIPVDQVVLWNRTDGSGERLKGARITLLDDRRQPVWEQTLPQLPAPSLAMPVTRARAIRFASGHSDFVQRADLSEKDIESNLANNADPKSRPDSAAPRQSLILIPAAPVEASAGSTLVLTLDRVAKSTNSAAVQFRLSASSDSRAREVGRIPASTLSILRLRPEARTDSQRDELARYYRSIAPELKASRDQLAALQKQADDIKPLTTVPILRELTGDQRRKTHIQRRGNFMDLGNEVSEGLPATFQSPALHGAPDRVALARWLVDESNPLTARVTVNRFWEAIFGIGIVRTSEEFGAQGEPPTHPELLDWLATELIDHRWDIKHLLRLMVTSAAYRQSSRVTPEAAAADPDNRWLARGPRFRLSAETIRDQAMFLSGLLSRKMHGMPVKPPQPKLGLSAAFGSATDWETSTGEDRYRRALYTTWRRSNPYPSMSTFDAPNREVCTVRRDRSNTPLQALVTLNDPVYVEAAQALARTMATAGPSPADKARHGFELCLARQPTEPELAGILRLYAKAYERFLATADKARNIANAPARTLDGPSDSAELAAWTVVGNVLLNLDETLMKR